MGKYFKWFLVSISMVLLTACGGGGSGDTQGSEDPIVQPTLETQKVRIYLPDVNSSNDINVSTLSVISFAEDNISITDVTGVVQVVDPEDNTIFLSYNIPGVSVSLAPSGSANTVDTKIDFSIRSTAYSLIMMVVSPSIDASEKSKVSSLILEHTDFEALVEQITLAYKDNPRYLEVLGEDINLVDSIRTLAKNVLQEHAGSDPVAKQSSSVPNSKFVAQRLNNVSFPGTWEKVGPNYQPQLGRADNGNRLAVINATTIFWGAEFKSCKNNITEDFYVPRVTSYGVVAALGDFSGYYTTEAIKELTIGKDISNETVYMKFYANGHIEYFNNLQFLAKLMSIAGDDLYLQNFIDTMVAGHLVINDYTECLWQLVDLPNKTFAEQAQIGLDTLGCLTYTVSQSDRTKEKAKTAWEKFTKKALSSWFNWTYKVYQLGTEAMPLKVGIDQAKQYPEAYFALTWDGNIVIDIFNNNVMPACTSTTEASLGGSYTVEDNTTVYDNSVNYQKDYYESGAIKRITPYVNGIIHGTVINYFESGGVMDEIPFVNGVLDGLWKHYYEDGSYGSTPFENGIKNGISTYYVNGFPFQQTSWKNDIQDGPYISYYKNSYTKSLVWTYTNGILAGPYKTYYESGLLESEGTHVNNGVQHGLEIWYYENGDIKAKIPYDNGTKNGTAYYYTDTEVKIEVYDNGQLLSIEFQPYPNI